MSHHTVRGTVEWLLWRHRFSHTARRESRLEHIFMALEFIEPA